MLEKLKILLVDDDLEICEVAMIYAEKNDINLTIISNPLEVMDYLENNEVDFIILDIMMPILNGYELFELIKEKYNIPTLFLTSEKDEDNAIKGLSLGVEDYIIKPFSYDQLFLKIQIILERINKHEYIRDDFKFDILNQELIFKGEKIKLTSKAYHLLFLLVKNKNEIVTREMIFNEIWHTNHYDNYRTIDSHIKEIRKKIDGDCIKTIRGEGYMYEKN